METRLARAILRPCGSLGNPESGCRPKDRGGEWS